MKRSQRGFTLVELIIVIAVIGVLAAILIPVFANVIKKANAKSALSDARNAVSLYVTEATERMTRGDDVPEHITLLVKKAGRYYVFGYDFNVSQSIQVSNVNDEGGIEAADFNALVSGHSWNGLHAGTEYDPNADTSSYTVENDGAFYLVPYDNNGVPTNTNVRGFITSGGEKYRRLDDAEELNLSVGNSTEVYHGCLVGASFTTESSTGNTPGTNPGGNDPVVPDPVQYTVTLDLNGVDVPGYQTSYQVNEGDEFTCNNPSATGKTFNGWKENDSTVTLPLTNVHENHTLVAQWSTITHTITIDPTWSGNNVTITGIPAEFNGGYTWDAPEGTNLNDIIGVLHASDITGKDFLGWTINGTNYDSSVTNALTADVTIAPVYGTTSLTVTFKVGTNETTINVDYGEHIDSADWPTNPSDDPTDGHFRHWSYGGGTYTDSYPNAVTQNMTFTAVFGWYSVTFYETDGTSSISTTHTGDTYNVPAPTLTSQWYYLSAWTASAGATACAADATTYTANKDNITLTAVEASKTITVSYVVNEQGATAPANATITLAASRDYTVEAAPVIDGRNFTGYTAVTNGVTINAATFNGGDTLTVQSVSSNTSGTITLTANYEDAPQSSVHEIWNEADFLKIGVETGWDLEEGTQYKLMADFSFSSNINGLGTGAAPFNAEFDGNSHTITVPSGVTLAKGGNDAIFYVVGEHGTIKGLTVDWNSSTQVYMTGAIACYNDGLIENCTATGTLKVKTQSSSMRSAGGICYWNENDTGRGIIRNCISNINLNGSYGLGGIAARNDADIIMCGSTGTLTPGGYATATIGSSSRRTSTCGGIASENTGTIDQCWSNCTITGNYALNGGLVGYVTANTSIISNSYFFGYINSGGGSYGRLEGGLIGAVKYGTVRQCYCIGRVNAYNANDSWYVYGYKYNDGTWQGVYWHKGQLYQRGTQNTSADSAGTNANASAGYGLAQNEWTNAATFTGSNYSTEIWDLTTPYPTLINNPVPTGVEVKPYGMSVYIPPVVRSHEIATAADFLKIGVDSEWNMWDTYTVVNDIDFGGASIAPRGKSISTPFSGTFDGQGHKLYNFNFNVSTEGGLFFEVTGTVKNMVADTGTCTVSGTSMGLIACYLDGSGRIEKCGATGTISGTQFLGGLIDQLSGTAVLSQCWSNVVVTASGSQGQSGVIMAACDGGTVEDCVAFGSVSGSYVGAVVGYCDGGTFNNVFSLSKVSTNRNVETASRPMVGYYSNSNTGMGCYFLKGMMYNNGTVYTGWDNQNSPTTLNAKGLTSDQFTTETMTTYSTSVWDFSGTYPKLINAAGMSSVTVAPYAG